MELTILVLFAFLIAFLLNLCFTPIIVKVARHYQLFDRLNARKIHTGEISRLAGIGIFLASICGAIITIFFIKNIENLNIIQLLPLLGVLIVFGIGLADDFYELRARYKLIAQILASLLVVASGLGFTGISLPGLPQGLGFGVLGYFLTFAWVLGITNAINLIDGMDGLAGSVSFFASLTFGVIYVLSGYYFQATIALAIAGSILGFLCFNRPKAKIFMGDGGAYYLGYALALIPIINVPAHGQGWLQAAGLDQNHLSIIHAITPLLLPIGDTLAAIVRRKRKGQKFSEPDRHHMHHKMLAMGMSTWQILGIIAVLEIMLAAAVVFDVIASTWFSGIALALSWLVVVGFFVYLDRAQYRKA